MPLVCEGGLCEYVPPTGKGVLVEKESTGEEAHEASERSTSRRRRSSTTDNNDNNEVVTEVKGGKLVCEGGLCEYVPNNSTPQRRRKSQTNSSSTNGSQPHMRRKSLEDKVSTSPNTPSQEPNDVEINKIKKTSDDKSDNDSSNKNNNSDDDDTGRASYNDNDDDDDESSQDFCGNRNIEEAGGDCSDENIDQRPNTTNNNSFDESQDDDLLYQLDNTKIKELLQDNDDYGCIPAVVRRRLSNDQQAVVSPTQHNVTTATTSTVSGDAGGTAPGATFVVYNPYVVKMILELNNLSDVASASTSSASDKSNIEKVLDIINRFIYSVETDAAKYGTAIGFHGGIGSLLTCMKSYNNKSSKIQERSCRLLGLLLTENPNHQIRVSENFGVTRILAAMTTYRNKVNLHKEALWALSTCMEMDVNAYQFTMNRGVNTIVKSLKTFPKSPIIQLHGTTILRLLSIVNNGYMICCIDYPNVVDQVVQAMRHHKRINKLQVNGCSILYALAREGKNETQDSLMKHNVIQLLLHCMNENLDIAIIQCQCCSALRYLATTRHDARDSMVRDGAVQMIWDSMKVHPKNINVQREGSKALKCLSKGPKEDEKDLEDSDPSLSNSIKSDLPDCINDECYE